MKPAEEESSDDKEKTSRADFENRKKDYSEYKFMQEQLEDLYPQVEKGFADKTSQNDTIDECWSAYHCELNDHQGYVGNSRVYVPIIRDALVARETRFINMLFPQTGRYIDIVGHEGKVPFDLMALLDDYVHKAELRTKIAPALIRTGDITGNYDLYLEWAETTRHITNKKKVAEHVAETGVPVEGSPEYDDVEQEEVSEGRPDVTVLDCRNLVLLPVTSTSMEEITESGVAAVQLWFSKAKIKKYIKLGIFTKEAGEKLLDNMETSVSHPLPNTGKTANSAAGVRTDGKGNKKARVFQVWTKLRIESKKGGERRMMVTHFGGADLVLGCKRNPNWNDRVPIIHQPVEPNPDSIWGCSQVDPVLSIQYQANDVVNQGFDSAQYALLPIVMTDPEKNPRAGSMVLAMASVWLTDPNSTKFAEFPALWKDAFALVGACKEQIFQSLGVNPAMMPHGHGAKKPSQAEVAQEQQVALESSADNTTLIQEGVFSKVAEWFYDFDYQFRTEAITVKKYGQFGLQATMDQVEPFQTRERYEFRWWGTEGFKAIQQVQSMISLMNVLRGLPPQLLEGRRLNLGPLAEYLTGVVCGPRLAPFTLVDQRHQLTMSVEMENSLLHHGFPVQVHEMDDDAAHAQAHFFEFQELLSRPPQEQDMIPEAIAVRTHILNHMKQMKDKAAAGGMQPGLPGAPGGQPGAGLPGQPRPGAGAQMPTGPQAPAGAVRPDAMATQPPRKTAM